MDGTRTDKSRTDDVRGGGARSDGPRREDAQPHWADLPAVVRAAAVTAAARMLASVPPAALPSVVRPVARFIPSKRARRGAVALGRALADDVGFRALVAQHLPADFAHGGGLAEEAARRYLVGAPGLDDVLARLRAEEELDLLRARVAELTEAVEELAARWVGPTDAGPDRGGSRGEGRTGRRAGERDGKDDVVADGLRRRLRAQGVRHRDEIDRIEQRLVAAQGERDAALVRAERADEEAKRWRRRAERHADRAEGAKTRADRVRRDDVQRRADADRRIQILLDTIEGAVAGLRGEWRPVGGGESPADVVSRQWPTDPGVASRRSVDAPLLVRWLRFPHAHVIVDGYNVTKFAYGEVTLAEQRDRLVRSMASLASRTGAEATVVFDGAEVVAPSASVPGVRVLFSPPGVIADDVIRRLVDAEPAGRMVVVVTDDRAIVTDVRSAGARTAPTPVFLETLQR